MRVVELKIEDVAFGGKGVGREQGKAIFVPYVIEGERIRAEIVREKKQFAEALLVDVVEASPHRVQAPCPYFGRCGGCAYQHISYEHQLAIKSRQVRNVLERIGKLEGVPLRPIVPSPLPYGYRTRVTVHAQEGVTGFFRRDSQRLIDIEHCPISRAEVNRELVELRRRNPPDGHYTLRAVAAPRVFSQINEEVARALRELVASFIADEQELLIDAYCGSGFFAKALVEKFERVIGIDWERFAIAAATAGATARETYIAGDVEVELAAALQAAPAKTVLIVDPPATGLTSGVRRVIVDLAPAKLIYVSCNPATLARDLKELKAAFVIESATPLDMFPQTAEIEVAVHLTRKPADRSLPEASSILRG